MIPRLIKSPYGEVIKGNCPVGMSETFLSVHCVPGITEQFFFRHFPNSICERTFHHVFEPGITLVGSHELQLAFRGLFRFIALSRDVEYVRNQAR